MGASLVTLLSLLLVQTALARRVGDTSSLHAAPKERRAFVPVQPIVRVKKNSTPPFGSAHFDPLKRHVPHLVRRNPPRAQSHKSQQLRQVANPRDAAKRWEHRGAKRATASSVPVTTICNNSVGQYGQCGGMGYSGDTCCSSGWTCTVSDAYYSQCRPSATTCTNAFYSTCGGSSSPGVATCCPAGSACVAASEYYSQCLPGATTPQPWTSIASSTPTPTTSTSASTSTKATSTSSSTSAAPTCTGAPLSSWSQCGNPAGGWNVLSCCTTGYSCQYVNDWYYQCLAANPFNTIIPNTATSSAGSASSASASVATTSTASATIPTSTVVPPIAVPVCAGLAAPYSQCGGLAWLGATCCPADYTCVASNIYWSGCQPGASTPSSSSSSASASSTKTSTSTSATPTSSASSLSSSASSSKASSTSNSSSSSSASSTSKASSASSASSSSSASRTSSATSSSASAQPTSSAFCILGGGGSDGCTPYSVTAAGVTLPLFSTYPAYGHVNYAAIPCSQMKLGQSYGRPGSNWTPMGFGTNFDPNNNQPGGAYIGKSTYDFGLAKAAFPNGFCVTWVQVSMYNQHYGEGGQLPVCSSNCLISL